MSKFSKKNVALGQAFATKWTAENLPQLKKELKLELLDTLTYQGKQGKLLKRFCKSLINRDIPYLYRIKPHRSGNFSWLHVSVRGDTYKNPQHRMKHLLEFRKKLRENELSHKFSIVPARDGNFNWINFIVKGVDQ
jgi:hypothetical protein